MTKEIIKKKFYTSDLIHGSIINSYGFDVFQSYSSKLKLNLLIKYTKKTDSVLDAGCANGLFSFELSSHVSEIQAIDINEEFLELAVAKTNELNIGNVNFSFGDIEQIPFEDSKFDCVFSYSCLVLVENVHKALDECVRVAKNNAYLIFDLTGKYNLSHLYWRNFYRASGHKSFNAFSYAEIKNYCRINNLKILECHALGILDQWKYIPLVSRVASKISFIDRIIHAKFFDLDYFISNLPFLKPFANRWYIICQKI